MLNPHLYAALRKRFGAVHISNQGVKRVEEFLNGRVEVYERGEHYSVDCPFCGDTKSRLSVSYLWLVKPPLSLKHKVHLAHCYNEECQEIYDEKFYRPILKDIELAKLGLLDVPELVEESLPREQRYVIKLPDNLTPLTALPDTHPAVQFVKRKYSGIPYDYLAKHFELSFCEKGDSIFPVARGRVIFPIWKDGKLVSWQGRTIYDKVAPRWYLPPGFIKCFYNGDNVSPVDTPVIAEGIPASIACGPSGVAIFGKQLASNLKHQLIGKWSSAVIATDPSTFIPDPKTGRIYADEMYDTLKSASIQVKRVRYPAEIMDIAIKAAEAVKADAKKIDVPDPADIGMRVMAKLIKEAT